MSQNAPAISLDIARLDDVSALRCGNQLRRATQDAATIDEAASAVAQYLFDSFVIPQTGAPACVLVRVYVTRSYASLSAEQQQFARALIGERHALHAETKCLVLQGTAGVDPAWQNPVDSKAHHVIPLPSEELLVGQCAAHAPCAAITSSSAATGWTLWAKTLREVTNPCWA